MTNDSASDADLFGPELEQQLDVLSATDIDECCEAVKDTLIPICRNYWVLQTALEDAVYWEDDNLEPPELELSQEEYDWLESEFNADFVKSVKAVDEGLFLYHACELLGYSPEDTALSRRIVPCDWVSAVGEAIQSWSLDYLKETDNDNSK